MLTQGGVPDTLAPALNDSPAGLAAWLVSKYRDWSDCGGDVETRFTLDQLCDFLTIYWATGTISSSIRLYAAEARDRWKLGAGERIEVPAAVADFPQEILHPPREWAERTLGDLRQWTEHDRGGHFAAWEEPELSGARPRGLPARGSVGKSFRSWRRARGSRAVRPLAFAGDGRPAKPETLRLFTALDIPDHVRDGIAAWGAAS